MVGKNEEIRPEDVGLRPDGARYFQELDERGARGTPAITTKNLYECDTFTVAAFLLSPGKVMPLHDHPRMTVFSKILMGSAHVTSYDWVQPSLCLDRRWLLAQKVLDKEFTPESGAWALYPDTGGNVHRLAAGADGPCAFIDVLSPPYGSPLQQIGGSFYEDMPFKKIHPAVPNQISEEQKGKLAWLQQIGVPKDLNLITLQNRGPGSQ
ncbi:plant cysteine oxidase 1 [Brachypodium distachyon]|uniref:plant cysteine oxidase 1 n=1 Tax=Brachypodium distachyon TaxID=15368 RepID=UPI000D0DBBE1|nr:plant cysteine oxidase 1 [Brachypodium distachyon]|eukprot:XP_024312563.1 plant cysteine oxidase 1 [Brachypodium distachyon]